MYFTWHVSYVIYKYISIYIIYIYIYNRLIRLLNRSYIYNYLIFKKCVIMTHFLNFFLYR